ncbi:MAG: endolytic transglycosylase MltG [Immundisolibacterales bacterium]|nr:endolytic transglycosylase MltG [Immundisolibacterales bacterium]
MRAVGLAALGAVLAAAAVGTYWLATDVERFMQTPMNVPAGGYPLLVKRGESLSAVADRLATDAVLTHPRYLAGFARWHERDRRIQAGEYLVPHRATPARLLEMMERGEIVRHRVRLIEGWSWRRALAEIQSHPLVRSTIEIPADFTRQLDLPTRNPEGWFLPATYEFRRGSTDVVLLEMAHRAMVEHLDTAWAERSPELPYRNPYEALILASIVEKEAAVADERPRIAGVFVRRLKRGMRLEADPTVIYGLGETFDGNLTRKDLRQDTPYNTYRRAGLPPTPIALPGAAALHAALHPAGGDALFFVASEHGRHVFSATLAEHRRAVDIWQRGRRSGKSP